MNIINSDVCGKLSSLPVHSFYDEGKPLILRGELIISDVVVEGANISGKVFDALECFVVDYSMLSWTNTAYVDDELAENIL